MILNGVEFPDKVLVEIIGQQTIMIDHLRYVVKELETAVHQRDARIAALTEGLEKVLNG